NQAFGSRLDEAAYASTPRRQRLWVLASSLAVSGRRKRRFSPPRGLRTRPDLQVEPAGALALRQKISAFGAPKPPNSRLALLQGAVAGRAALTSQPVQQTFEVRVQTKEAL